MILLVPSAVATADVLSVDELGKEQCVKFENGKIIDFNVIDKKDYSFKTERIAVMGNWDPIEKEEIDDLLKSSDIVLIYDTKLNFQVDDSKPNNKIEIHYYKNHTKVSHYFRSSTTDENELKQEINDFANEKLDDFNSNDFAVTSYNADASLFNVLYSTSFREMSKPYGYIDCDYNVLKYRTNDVSSLYIVEATVYFVPGIIAKKDGASGFKNYKNEFGYFHINASNAEVEVGYGQVRRGGTPVFKDAYPVNTPGTISIASTYNIGTNMGYSFKNGFSKDGISIGTDKNLGLNISYSYNKTYTTAEPALSVQKTASNPQTFSWQYQYSSNREETNCLKVGYIFEMNNKGHEMREGDVALTFDYLMKVKYLSSKSFSGHQFHNWY